MSSSARYFLKKIIMGYIIIAVSNATNYIRLAGEYFEIYSLFNERQGVRSILVLNNRDIARRVILIGLI